MKMTRRFLFLTIYSQYGQACTVGVSQEAREGSEIVSECEK